MNILGISCWYHDAAATLLQDGTIVAAAQEERFSREKHDPSFPQHAIEYCLQEGDIESEDLDIVAFYDKPFLKFERLLETYVSYAPWGLRSFIKAMQVWLTKKLWIPNRIEEALSEFDGQLIFPEHHESHAASAFYPSPFERAAFITTDGVGEWATTSYGIGQGSDLRIEGEIHFPHSVGLLYSAFTYFCGFRVNSGEYKLMGLAPYGEPKYANLILEELIDLKEDGSFRLNMEYFTYPATLRMTGKRFASLFGGERRQPESELTQREMDLARSIQLVTEEAMLRMARHTHSETGMRNLCLAGGVALNCVANGRILREGPFENVWIQPAAGDAGGALGAALMAWYQYLDEERSLDPEDSMQGTFLGPGYTEDEIEVVFEEEGIPYKRIGYDDLLEQTAKLIAEGNVVGWYQGRMEWGPRALGHRSILADPRSRDMQRVVNQKIKFRESFRPFAPSVLVEGCNDYFELDRPSPYMLLVDQVKGAEIEGEGLERLQGVDSPVPAVTHVDGSARIQTVYEETAPLYYQLLKAFEDKTGCPVVINTSFNVRGEPIVRSPSEAYKCFRRTHMDVLVMGPFLTTKAMIPGAEEKVFSEEEIVETYGLD